MNEEKNENAQMKEEMNVAATVGPLLGVVENSFIQHGKPHAEINLVYRMEVPPDTTAQAAEDWIDFEWRPIDDLAAANILPPVMKKFFTEEPGSGIREYSV